MLWTWHFVDLAWQCWFSTSTLDPGYFWYCCSSTLDVWFLGLDEHFHCHYCQHYSWLPLALLKLFTTPPLPSQSSHASLVLQVIIDHQISAGFQSCTLAGPRGLGPHRGFYVEWTAAAAERNCTGRQWHCHCNPRAVSTATPLQRDDVHCCLDGGIWVHGIVEQQHRC